MDKCLTQARPKCDNYDLNNNRDSVSRESTGPQSGDNPDQPAKFTFNSAFVQIVQYLHVSHALHFQE